MSILVSKFLTFFLIVLGVSMMSAQNEYGFSLSPYLQFNQQNFGEDYSNIGYYKYYQNTLTVGSNRYKMMLKAGVVEQGLYNTSLKGIPLLQRFIGGEVEYSATDRMKVYASGQYLSTPFNRKKITNNEINMNPLFAQTEIRAGIRAQVNMLQLDISVYEMFDTQSKVNNDGNAGINGKLSLSF